MNTKLYINSKILRAVYLDSFSDFLTSQKFSKYSSNLVIEGSINVH